jgi:hypothetical protein
MSNMESETETTYEIVLFLVPKESDIVNLG